MNKERNIHTKLITTLDLPQDLFLGLPNICLSGNKEFYTSNHQGILSYDETEVHVLVKDFQIQIKGKGQQIFSYSRDELTIRGFIRSIEFM